MARLGLEMKENRMKRMPEMMVAAVGERDKTVIENPETPEPKKSMERYEFPDLSEKASGKADGSLIKKSATQHGKDKGLMLIEEAGGKEDTSLTNTIDTQLGKEKGGMMIEEMEWQKAEEEQGSEKARTVGFKKAYMGRNDVGPFEDINQNSKGEMGQKQQVGEIVLSQPNSTNDRSISQKAWKRRTKDDDLMTENNGMQTPTKMGKRRMKETGMGAEVEEVEKRRKVTSDIAINVSVEAASQPRRDQ